MYLFIGACTVILRHVYCVAIGYLEALFSLPCSSVKSADAPAGKFSNHDDELMTPPDILLERGLDECIEFAKSNAEVNMIPN